MNSLVIVSLAFSAIFCIASAMPNQYGYEQPSYKQPSYKQPSYGYVESKSAVPHYNFDWRVKAIGSGKQGYGGGYDDGYSKGEALEFGQQEQRYGDETKGSWDSQLPYGSNMKMDYVIVSQKKGYGGY